MIHMLATPSATLALTSLVKKQFMAGRQGGAAAHKFTDEGGNALYYRLCMEVKEAKLTTELRRDDVFFIGVLIALQLRPKRLILFGPVERQH